MSLSFLSVFIFNPFGSNIFELPKVQFLTVFLCLLLISFSIYTLKKEKLEILHNKYVAMFFCLWLLSLTVSTVFSIAPMISFWGSYDRLSGLASHLVFLAYFLVFLNVFKTKEKQEIFLKILVAIASLVSIHAILQKLGIDIFSNAQYETEEFVGRSFSTLGHPNFLGQFLILPFWAAIYFLIFGKNKTKYIYVFIGVLILMAVIFAQNRATLLGILIGAIFFLLINPKIKTKYKYMISAVSILGFIASIIFLFPDVRSLFSRVYLWEGGLKAFLYHPFVGSGLETFQYIFQKVLDPAIFNFEQLYSFADRAHNSFMDILVTQGIFGLSIFSSIIIALFYGFFKKFKKLKTNNLLLVLMSALVSILISNFFSFPTAVHYLEFAAIVAMILLNTVKFKTYEIRQKIFLVFTTIVIFVGSLFVSIHAVNTIKADNLLAKDNIIDLIDASLLNPYQEKIYSYLADELIFAVKYSPENERLFFDAETVLEQFGNFTNKDYVYYLLKGRLYGFVGKIPESEKYFETGAMLAPKNPMLFEEWATTYFQAKEYKKAASKYEEFFALLPDFNKFNKEQIRLFIKHAPFLERDIMEISESYKKIGEIEKSNYYLQIITETE